MRRLILLCSLLVLSACVSQQKAVSLSAVDGDTLSVMMGNGHREKVRVVGIDTPETVDPRKPVGCYGREASARMHALTDGKNVLLTSKPDEDRDRYGRLLRYVSVDGTDIGALLIREGYARSYRSFPHPRQTQYDALEWEAQAEKRGMWKACAFEKSR